MRYDPRGWSALDRPIQVKVDAYRPLDFQDRIFQAEVDFTLVEPREELGSTRGCYRTSRFSESGILEAKESGITIKIPRGTRIHWYVQKEDPSEN